MRPSTRKALMLAALGAAAGIWSGCEAKQQTEYVAGVSTQVQVPRDLKTIRIDISVGGSITFCRAYKVYEGRVQLPRSLGAFPVNTEANRLAEPVSVTVTGFTDDLNDAAGQPVFDCLAPVKVGENARILRRSRQPYVKDQILFLPMALKYACFDVNCEDGASDKTCKAGRCVSAVTDERTLPQFSSDLVDGTGAACFRTSECMAAASLAVPVDTETCTYAVPLSASAPAPAIDAGAPPPTPPNWDGVNVEVVYDGGYNREILDKDDVEGFVIPDPAKPQQFRLAPGLCDLVKGIDENGVETKHRITAVRASGTCRAKSPFQPLCANDQLAAMGLPPDGVAANSAPPNDCGASELKPAKSALMLLVDETENHSVFFNKAGAEQTAVNLSLNDPSFQRTDLGLTFFPGPGPGVCSATTRAVEPTLARDARKPIADALGARPAPNALRPLGTPVELRQALEDAYTYLATKKDAGDANGENRYHKRAVVVFGNRGFNQNVCGGTPVDRATQAATAATERVQTYVIMLARDTDPGAPPDPLPEANALAVAGGTPGAYDGRKPEDKARGFEAFQQIVKDLATCVYDVPAPLPQGAVLTYTDPVAFPARTVAVRFDAACNAEGAAANGWGVDQADPRRVRICGAACEDYRTVLRNSAAYAAQYLQSAPPVPIFAHKAECAPAEGSLTFGGGG